jgi:hypothetical protein
MFYVFNESIYLWILNFWYLIPFLSYFWIILLSFVIIACRINRFITIFINISFSNEKFIY